MPVDDVGYVLGSELLKLPDHQFLNVVHRMEATRYGGWRNSGGLWRQHMGLDDIHGKRVLDYGCGLGVESLQYAKAGNAVSVADINQESIDMALRVLQLHGYSAMAAFRIREESPGKLPGARDGEFDLVAMNGVLHHIEDPLPAVQEAHRVLDDGGELRVMVYTDIGWRLATGSEPPEDVTGHPQRPAFVRWGDEVGDWADWYDGERLEKRFGQWFRVREWHYIGHAADGLPPGKGRYGIGILEKR